MFSKEIAMKKVLILGVALLMLLAGCAPETEKADSTSPGRQQKVENSAPLIEDKYTAEEAAKASANHEVTPEVLSQMSGDYATLLGNCQLIKYQQENGPMALGQWTEDFLEEVASASSGDVVSVQQAMIKEGYSCTFQEMNQVATTGTL